MPAANSRTARVIDLREAPRRRELFASADGLIGEARSADHQMGPGLWLGLLDGFALRVDGALITLQPGSRRLLAYLALHRRGLSRAALADALWPEAAALRASGNLRSALWRLRRAAEALVTITGEYVALGEEVVCDLGVLQRRATALLAGSFDPDSAAADIELFAHDLLPHWAEDWIVLEREHICQLRLHALELLAAELTAAGRHGLAVEAATAAIRADPLREPPRRLLVEVYLAEGNAVQAAREHRAYAALLKVELGIAPSAQMLALVAALPW